MTLDKDPDARLEADIERTARPAEVRAALTRLLARHPSLRHHLDQNAQLRSGLFAVLGASRSLTRLIDQRPEAIDVLADLDAIIEPPHGDALDIESLVRWHRLAYLRIAARDVSGLADLEATGHDLANLAADVFAAAYVLAGSPPLAVIGMGKVGGDELNYASDVDVIFVGDGERDDYIRSATLMVDIAGRCFRVDTNLRPEGRDGPLARSLDSYEAYWDRWAEPWEFQALLRARPLAGDPALGQRFLDTAQRWLWNQPFDAEALRSLRAMKARSEAEAEREHGALELKRSPGGIRDIEFTAQLLQLVHGHLDPRLRLTGTVPVLAELGRAGYIDPTDAEQLTAAYGMLRTLEHRVQLADEHQTHELPDDPDELTALARSMGFTSSPTATASAQLLTELRQVRNRVRSIHERVYFRPLLEAFAGSAPADAQLRPAAAAARLAAFGFTDTERTQSAVRELTKGLNRSSRMMQQLLPLLLDWLSAAPDPDLGLLLLRNLLSGTERATTMVETFRESPDAARRACTVLGTSRMLGDILLHNPDLVARLPHPGRLALAPRADLVASAATIMGWRDDLGEKQQGLRRWRSRNLAGIASRDLFGFATIAEVERDLSALAEACIQAAVDTHAPSFPFAVIGLGRFGAAELSYASDLDMLFVYEGDDATRDEANRLAASLLRFLGGHTPAQRLWDIDLGLRPEGRRGALVRRVEGYVQYWDAYAEPWERMAMTRARVVAGDAELGERLLAAVAPFVWDRPVDDQAVREIRRLKARMEHERIPADEDPQFHLKLGRGSLSDVEFTVQLLQLQAGVRDTATLPALEHLRDLGHIDDTDADVLSASFRFCERARNRWFLVNSGAGDSLPSRPEQLLWLARSLDTTPSELREEYRRVTRRARRVTERRFYGTDDLT